MLRFFNLYQYIVPILLFPLSYYLWLLQYQGNHRMVFLVLSIPVITSYVIPALGTNLVKLWEFNTRLRLGRFRPHHGFVFGTATSLLALICTDFSFQGTTWNDVLRSGFILGSVLGFWNWIYDIYAVKSGFIIVYNRQYFEGRDAESIATDYAPVYFGTFGFCYGAAISIAQYQLLEQQNWEVYWLLLAWLNMLNLVLPTTVFAVYSYLKNGYFGLGAFRPKDSLNSNTVENKHAHNIYPT